MDHELYEIYREQYSRQYNFARNKLPKTLGDRQDLIARLSALYDLLVQDRGHAVRWDDSAIGKINQVTTWLFDSPQRGLLLYGSLGNGKTTMLKSIHRLFSGKSYYVTAKRIFDSFKDSERIPVFQQDSILLIDDLGAEPERCLVYGEEHHPLTDVLLRRYDENSTTIVATNLPEESIRQRYGDRLFDRISEMYAVILYNSPSYRTQF